MATSLNFGKIKPPRFVAALSWFAIQFLVS